MLNHFTQLPWYQDVFSPGSCLIIRPDFEFMLNSIGALRNWLRTLRTMFKQKAIWCISVGTGTDSAPTKRPETVGEWAGHRSGNKAQHDFNSILCHQLGERSLDITALISSFRNFLNAETLYGSVWMSTCCTNKSSMRSFHQPRALIPLLIS